MNIFKNRFLTNTAWLVGGKIFQMAISLLISTLTARYLGPGNFGIINYTNAYIAFFSSICQLGLNGIIIKEMVSHRDDEGTIIGTAIVMRLITSIISMVSIYFMFKTITPNDTIMIKVAMLQSVSILFASFDIINFWYQSKLQSKITTIIQSMAYVVMSLYRVIILILNKDVTWFAFAVSLDTIVIAVLLLYSYSKNKEKNFSFSFIWVKKLLSQSWPFILSGIMITVYGQMDKIMIGEMMDKTSVGLYSIAITITGLWSFIPIAFLDSARPLIMEAKTVNQELYVLRLKQLYCFIIWLSFAYALAMSIMSKLVIYILYGEQYIGAQSALVITVWYCAFSYLGAAKNIWIICEGKMKYETIFTLSGAILNIVLNYFMIPLYGIVGAAVATLVTQIVTNFVVMFFFSETRENAKLIVDAFLFRGIGNINSIKKLFLKNKLEVKVWIKIF